MEYVSVNKYHKKRERICEKDRMLLFIAYTSDDECEKRLKYKK